MKNKLGITRVGGEAFGDILRSPELSLVRSVIMDAASRDTGNPVVSTQLRAGLVLARNEVTGRWQPFGNGWELAETTANGDDSNTRFETDRDHVIPGSVNVEVNGVAVDFYVVSHEHGIIELLQAPPSGSDNVVITYMHVPFVADEYVFNGLEKPLAILANPIHMLDMEGNAAHTEANVYLAGWVKEEAVIVNIPQLEWYAKKTLATHGFFGLTYRDL